MIAESQLQILLWMRLPKALVHGFLTKHNDFGIFLGCRCGNVVHSDPRALQAADLNCLEKADTLSIN